MFKQIVILDADGWALFYSAGVEFWAELSSAEDVFDAARFNSEKEAMQFVYDRSITAFSRFGVIEVTVK